MKRIAFYLSLVLVVLVLASCKKGQKNLFTPTSSGRPYEVLVVVNKAVWDRPAGRALFDVLDTNVPGLPQAERSFRISNIAPEHFDRVMRIFRNIIVVDIQDIYQEFSPFRLCVDIHPPRIWGGAVPTLHDLVG